MSKGEAGMGYCPFSELGRDLALGSRQLGPHVSKARAVACVAARDS